MDSLVTLGEVLGSADDLPWNHALYLPPGESWSLESRALVWDPNDVEDDSQDDPVIAVRNGMSYALGIQDVQGIVLNAVEQIPGCALEQKLAAFIYYWRHDAFIDFTA